MRIKIQKGFISQRTGKKVSIFDAEKSLLYTFNHTATFMFDRLKKGLEIPKIVKDVTKEFRVSEINAGKDLKEFIEDLKEKKIAKEIIDAK